MPPSRPSRPEKSGGFSLPFKGPKSKPGRAPADPLDRKQEALRQKEEQLRQTTEKLQRLIEEAPRLRAERARQLREQLASDPRLSASHTALVDKRYNLTTTTAPTAYRPRRLRSEKRDGKVFFVFLCVVFSLLMFWIWQLISVRLGH